MGFHKRWITDESILASYRNEGIESVWRMFTSGADALILHGELASQCNEAIWEAGRDGLEKVLSALDK
jgi:hypothetical protein